MIIACNACGLQYDVRAFTEGTIILCRCQHQLLVPAHVVGVVRCPSCAGTVDASAQRCLYCQSLVSRHRCPSCAVPLRAEAKFCDQCGATVDDVGAFTARASERSCPRCRVPMFHDTCAGLEIEGCAECLGMWVPHAAVRQLVERTPRHIKPVTDAAPSVRTATPAAAPAAPIPPGGAAYIPCPSCGQLMNPKNYGGTTGIQIDFCALHGIWFDANELNQMLESVARDGASAPLAGAAAIGPDPRSGAAAASPEAMLAAEETRRRFHARTLAAIEQEREESLEAVMGDAAFEVVDWLRAKVRKLRKR